jgi:predicted RNA methylase
MLPVPLFGEVRAGQHQGEHVILLDGEKASFLFSSVEHFADVSADDLLAWAWSSNVAHSLVSEAATGQLLLRRWADRDWEKLHRTPSQKAASNIVERFRQLPQPGENTVVGYALYLFRTLRSNLEKRGADSQTIVRAFNALLLWTTLSHDGPRTDATLRDILDDLTAQGWSFSPHKMSARILGFPAEEFFRDVRERAATQPYPLDVDLMFRHALGVIYQEAHQELMEPLATDDQRLLFDNYSVVPDVSTRVASRGVYYTRAEFARALVLEAVRAFNMPLTDVHILDPACGSGVFLIESAREMLARDVSSLRLSGFDSSAPACEMADCRLRYHLQDVKHITIKYRITCRNSLTGEPWDAPLIVMNPPFIAWNDMSEAERVDVSRILGSLPQGPPDMATAFLYRAAKSLPPGGVVASIIPVSFLDNKANERIRKELTASNGFSLRLIGRFAGFKLFKGAAVEAAFVVIARNGGTGYPRLVLARDEDADTALRKLRRTPTGDIGDARIDLERGRWTPRSDRTSQLIQSLQKLHVPQVESLFEVHLGVRTGDNTAFLITVAELFDFPERERQYFRPVAGQDTIRTCTVRPSQYVFYPYDSSGRLMIESEKELNRVVPQYFKTKLARRRHTLESRHRIGDKWWVLNRRRPKWPTGPRIVSPSFVEIGKFAFDANGKYVVVQGNAWRWKSSKALDEPQWMAYVALMNSPAFMLLLSHYSRQVSGKQYQADAAYSNHVPLPDISTSHRSVVKRLAEMGRDMTEGWFPNINELDEAVASCYGVSAAEFENARPIMDEKERKETFARLARRCRREAGVLSNPEQIAAYPAYQQIVRMGKPAVPYIVRAMQREDGDFWFAAMRAITGEEPQDFRTADNVNTAVEMWASLAQERGWQ